MPHLGEPGAEGSLPNASVPRVAKARGRRACPAPSPSPAPQCSPGTKAGFSLTLLGVGFCAGGPPAAIRTGCGALGHGSPAEAPARARRHAQLQCCQGRTQMCTTDLPRGFRFPLLPPPRQQPAATPSPRSTQRPTSGAPGEGAAIDPGYCSGANRAAHLEGASLARGARIFACAAPWSGGMLPPDSQAVPGPVQHGRPLPPISHRSLRD